jgi:multiple sugar transport system substrate-binding protein
MRKSLTLLIALLLAAAMVLAACGGKEGGSATGGNNASGNAGQSSGGTSSEGSSGGSASEQVEVTLSGWGASPEEQELLQQTLDEFMAKNPDIKVKYEVIADQYQDVINTRLIGGEGPDVFYLDSSEAPKLIASGALEPLDDYVARTPDFDIADFEEPLLNAFRGEDGKYYGFPKGYSTLVLFYNKKMFAEAGITEPPKTWEEFAEVARKLTKGKDVYGFGVAPEAARQMYMVEAYGGKFIDENGRAAFASPEALRGLQLIMDLRHKDQSAAQASDVGTGWGGEMFGQQKAAMVFEGNWAIPFLLQNFPDLEFGTAELPTVNGKKGTMAFTVAYVMNKDSKNKEAAWRLLSFLTGKEGMKIWTSKGFELPSRKSVAAELGYDKDELRGAIVAGGAYATPWQGGKYLPIIASNFNNQFVSAFIGDQSLEDAMKLAQETANKEIEAMQ